MHFGPANFASITKRTLKNVWVQKNRKNLENALLPSLKAIYF